ncbi:MAG: type II secretion system F family protein, partial [Oscillospiraceae bacterium]
MAVFKYEALSRSGSVVSGDITANDESGAVQRLGESGFTVLSLAMQKEKKKKADGSKKKVKVSDLSLFSRQLSAMIGAGIPITQSIATLSKQTENITLREALVEIASSVEGGSSLTQAFSRHSEVFSPLYISMLSAGEVGGILETVLIRLSDQLQKQKQLNDNVKSATSYPKMIGGFAVLMFLAMMTILVPIFEGFIPSNAEIPAITKFTFALSNNLRSFWYIWLVVFALLVFFIVTYAKSKSGHKLWENTKMKIPLFGPIMLKSVIARFSRTLSTLLQGGIPVVQALQSAGPTSGSDLIAKAVEKAVIEIEEGNNVSGPLEKSGLFPPMVINMIAIGEESGTLPELLDKIAEFYEEDVSTMTKNLGSMIEPIMLILIGVIVGGMLLSLYLPI